MSESKDKLLIIDGHNLLFQMFYGMPARIRGKNGKLIQATLGFTGATLKMIDLINPSHVIAIFDGEHENERAQIDADYKANRPDLRDLEEEDNPFSQLEDVYRALDLLKIKRFECSELEADDLIASYALTYGESASVTICSADSDFYQLITPTVQILRYRGGNSTIIDQSFIIQKYGITPNVFADFKALSGDGADNVKGAPSIGPKTASKLLNEYGTLEGVLQGAKTLKEGRVKRSLTENAERLRRNYRIIKLSKRLKPPFSLDQLRKDGEKHSTKAVLTALDLI